MRKLVIIGAVIVLVLCLAVPASLAAKPVEELETGNTSDLPVLKLPADLAGGSPQGPSFTPPGWGKPKPPPTPNKWAVVIGIADYEGTGADLWHPDEDAMEMKQALVTNYGFPEENIRMLLNDQATAQAIVNAIRWLASVEDADDTVVFFFCGHGFRVPDYAGWDTDREVDGYDEGIVTYDLYGLPDGCSGKYVTLGNEFKNFDSKKFALVFGSCYSGGMFDSGRVDLGKSGRVICSACKADQYGWDYWELDNTLFGYYFVDEGILQGLAEGLHVSGDGVSMEEALDYAYPRVTAEQPDSQPQIWDGFDGEFIP